MAVEGTSPDMLDLVGVQEVSRTEPVGEYTFFYGKESDNHELGTVFFLCMRESYQQVRGLS
jgi:hypothetical protein